MKIILAPDSFKGNLSALEVAHAFEKGIKRVLPKARCIKIPIADGGEGIVQSLVDATQGNFVRKKVTNPLGHKIFARYGFLGDQDTAVIEMAAASGLPLLDQSDYNPMKATTYGTGELILDAIHRGAKNIIIGIGGSATNDGGAGMAQALGVQFLNKHKRIIEAYASGGMLDKIHHIDTSHVIAQLRHTKITIACDVNNVLYGKLGASHVFGRQKGATPLMITKLDHNLKHFAQLIKKNMNKDIRKLKGGGAAGGLGAGLVAFTPAKIRSGIKIVLQYTNMEKHLKNAQLVISGEGQVDAQTAFGKAPSGVAKLAKKYRIPTILIAGKISPDAHHIFQHGIAGLESAYSRDMPLEESMGNAKTYLADAAERALRLVLVGKKIR